jgi:Putative peptidoglycan binding domain
MEAQIMRSTSKPAQARAACLAAGATIALLGAEHASPQQTVSGDCNVVIGDRSSANTVTLICLPSPPARSGGTGREDRTALVIDATTEGLRPGVRAFEIALTNRSESRRAAVSPGRLSLSDDEGRVYRLDCLSTRCADSVMVAPGRTIRLRIALDRPVSATAQEMDFTLSSIWYGERGASYMQPLGAVEWTVPIAAGDGERELEAAERGAGLTREARRAAEEALNALGFDAGSEDGVFDARTRRAIRRFQAAEGFPETGYLTRNEALTLSVYAAPTQSLERRSRWEKEWNERSRRFEEQWRGMDEEFRRHMLSHPPLPDF